MCVPRDRPIPAEYTTYTSDVSYTRLGLPGGTRTHNPQLRRLVLYPVELRAARMQRDPNLVGVERFELPTSCSQSKRATRLRHTPRKGANDTPARQRRQRKSVKIRGFVASRRRLLRGGVSATKRLS